MYLEKCTVCPWNKVAFLLVLFIGSGIIACNEQKTIKIDVVAAPSEISQGKSVLVQLTADNDLHENEISVKFAPEHGLTVNELILQDSNTVSFLLTATTDAALGARELVLESDSLKGSTAFSVVHDSEVESSFSCTPNRVKQGEISQISVVGAGTHFDAATSVVSILDAAGSGVTVGNLAVTDSITATFGISAAADAVVGSYNIQIISGDEEATGTVLVDNADGDIAPSISIEPNVVQAGTTASLVVTGAHTHFTQDTTANFGPNTGIVVLSVTADSNNAQRLIVEVEAESDAVAEQRVLTISTPYGTGSEIVTGQVSVTAAASMTLNGEFHLVVEPGDTLVVQMVGVQTHFRQNPDTAVEVSPDSEGVSLAVNSISPPTLIDSVLTVSEVATPGIYTVSATSQQDDKDKFDSRFSAEVVTATIEVKEPEDSDTSSIEDTDSESDLDTETETDTGELLDFTVTPNALRAGTFGADVMLEGGNGNWVHQRSIVSINGEQIILGNEGAADEDRCYVATGKHISCSVTVGLFADAGSYDVTVTTCLDDELSLAECISKKQTVVEKLRSTLEVTEVEIVPVAAPEQILPEVVTVSGAIAEGESKNSIIYAVNPSAGDVLVFHAVSKDRVNMDPIIRLINADGLKQLLYLDNETSGGIDSRVVFHFPSEAPPGKAYYIAVDGKFQDNFGDYDFHVYKLSHGGVIGEETEPNDDCLGGQTIALSASAKSKLVYSDLTPLDPADYYTITAQEPFAIDIVARRLGAFKESIADVKISLYDSTDTSCSNPIAQSDHWVDSASATDPRLFITESGPHSVVLKVETQGDALDVEYGFYALHLKPLVLINEIDNRQDAQKTYVELVGPSDYSLDGYSLCTYDAAGTPVDAANECLTFKTTATTNYAGYVAVYNDYTADGVLDDSDIDATTLDLPSGAGAVVLKKSGEVVDSVQFGGASCGEHCEYRVADFGVNRTIGRGAGVDTNDNWLDFELMADPTPGAANDRTCKSAVPLYGEF